MGCASLDGTTAAGTQRAPARRVLQARAPPLEVGEPDLALAEHVTSLRRLVEARGLPLAVDLSEVTFFGAWAADALVALRAAAPPESFTVRAASEPVRVTLDACGLTFGAPAHALQM